MAFPSGPRASQGTTVTKVTDGKKWAGGIPGSERGEARTILVRPKEQTSVASLFLDRKKAPGIYFLGLLLLERKKVTIRFLNGSQSLHQLGLDL